MKKIFKRLFVAILATLVLVGCGSKEDPNKVPADEDFIVNVGKGLEARWVETDSNDSSTMSTSEQQKSYRTAVQAELSSIGELSNYEFENKDLEELATQYVNALNLQMGGIQYVGTDDWQNLEKTWNRGRYYRIVHLKKLVDDFGLTVDPKYQTDLDDLMAEYSVAKEAIDNYEFAVYLADNLEYKKDDSRSNEWTSYYTTIVENTTDHEIEGISIEANFIDASGVTVYSSNSYINNIKSGAKAESELYYDQDKGDFDHIELTVSIY